MALKRRNSRPTPSNLQNMLERVRSTPESQWAERLMAFREHDGQEDVPFTPIEEPVAGGPRKAPANETARRNR